MLSQSAHVKKLEQYYQLPMDQILVEVYNRLESQELMINEFEPILDYRIAEATIYNWNLRFRIDFKRVAYIGTTHKVELVKL